jgi:hypothetical protein
MALVRVELGDKDLILSPLSSMFWEKDYQIKTFDT